jgi:hypothetical protein
MLPLSLACNQAGTEHSSAASTPADAKAAICIGEVGNLTVRCARYRVEPILLPRQQMMNDGVFK